MPDAPPPAWRRTVVTAATLAALLLLSAVLAVWGTFYVPLRVGGVPVPVSLALAVAGNLVLGREAGRLVGRAGAAAVGVTWLAVVLMLSSSRAEGDVVLYNNLGLAFLVLGAGSSAVAYSTVPRDG